MSGILQFIHGARFIASPLSTLANDFSGGIHKIKCKHGCDDKKCETWRIKYEYSDCFPEYKNFKGGLTE